MNARETDPDHVTQVCRLSLLIFDQISDWDDWHRFLLESAAMVHDLGWSIAPTGRGHHKASEQLVRDHAWEFIPLDTVDLIAQIARYHRKSPPKPSHPRFAVLDGQKKDAVRLLAGILRVGDALDRSHLQLIRELRCRIGDDEILMEAVSDGDLSVERAGLAKKSDLLADVYGRRVRLTRVVSMNR